MIWESRLLSRPEDADGEAAARQLITQQLATWPMFREAVEGLSQVRYRSMLIAGEEFRLQCNPARIVSASAKVDAASISRRPCFLCAGNLPPEERAVAVDEGLVLLCNPYPILEDHLVIADREHRPQSIHESFDRYLRATAWLGEGYFTLYNGPRCGASAPDHLHFQAGTRSSIPFRIFHDTGGLRRQAGSSPEGVEIFTVPDYPVNLLVIESADSRRLAAAFADLLNDLALVTGTEDEPLLNLLAAWSGGVWSVIIFPRSRHRPACYFAEGAARLTVSPGAVDLAGLLVLPDPEDFEKISTGDLAAIIDEVGLDDQRFRQWIDRVAARHGGLGNDDR